MIASAPLCDLISAWAMKNINFFIPNGHGRQYLSMETPATLEIAELKQFVMSTFNVPADSLQEPVFKDFCGINLEGANVHPHMDTNQGDLNHIRFNVLVSKPLGGGKPIHGEDTLEIEEGGMWQCNAGTTTHSSTPVIGTRPRIVMSYGFLLPTSYLTAT